MPSRRQCIKGCFQGGKFNQFNLKFFGHTEFAGLLEFYLQPGFFHLNRFMNVRSQGGFPLGYFSEVCEPDLARRLHIFRLLDENSPGIF